MKKIKTFYIVYKKNCIFSLKYEFLNNFEIPRLKPFILSHQNHWLRILLRIVGTRNNGYGRNLIFRTTNIKRISECIAVTQQHIKKNIML